MTRTCYEARIRALLGENVTGPVDSHSERRCAEASVEDGEVTWNSPATASGHVVADCSADTKLAEEAKRRVAPADEDMLH
jgi:hypothetical protein